MIITSKQRTFLIVLLLIVSLGLLAYYYYLYRNKQPEVTISSNGVITAQKTESTGEVVPGFIDFPRYPNTQIVNSYKKTEANKTGYEINLLSNDPVDQVTAWYAEQLPTYGWTIIERSEERDSKISQSLTVTKGPMKLLLLIEDEHQVGETEIGAEVPLFVEQ